MITPLELVIGLLAARLDCPVVSKVPSTRPKFFVRVDQSAPRAFGPSQDSTLIIVQVYGIDLERVLTTIGEIRRFLRFEVEHPNVVGFTEDSGPVEFPDDDLPAVHRWQLTGDLYTDLT